MNSQWKIINPRHIMYGMEFPGYAMKIGSEMRVFNINTIGQAYPLSDCIEITPNQ